MRSFPIVNRELRVGARRKSTRLVRVWTTVVAATVGAALLMFINPVGGTPVGMIFFLAIAGYAFLMCLLSGVFVTADCLSEEKRAGTLGLLFLTDLKGYDMVFGKFAVCALNPLLALLAVLPVISLSLLLGGVTVGEFWRMALVFLVTLWFSLTTGIFISSGSRESQKAAGATLMAVVLPAAALFLMNSLSLSWPFGKFISFVSLASPVTCFTGALDVQYLIRAGRFWESLAVVFLSGAVMLAAAMWRIHSAWRDDPLSEKNLSARRRPAGGSRGRLGDANPLLWLMESGIALRALAWGVVLLWIGVVLASYSMMGGINWPLAFYGSKGATMILKLLFVTQACKFFTEARRSGAMELLLCTPLTDREIVRVQWRHLRRLFLLPAVLLLMPACVMMLAQEFSGSLPVDGWLPFMNVSSGASVGFMFVVSTLTEFLALGEVGFWLSVSMKRPSLAPGTAALLVLLPPMIFFCIPDIYYDAALIAWARLKLTRDFRRSVSEQYSQVATV